MTATPQQDIASVLAWAKSHGVITEEARTALLTFIAGLVEDADRYRWLREQSSDTWARIGFNTWKDAPFVFPYRDTAIDAARKDKT